MKIKFVLASVAMLAVATPAMAQDTTEGFKGGARIEARGALDHVRVSVDGDGEGKSGFGYGVEAGYDAALSSIVVGAYVGIEGSTTKECISDSFAEGCVKAGRNFTAGVRVGGTVGKGLLYAKGGYSNVDDFDEGRNLDGFHLGAGYEMDISANTYVKAEYVYTNYKLNRDLGVNVDLERHQGLVGVGFRF